MGYVVSGANPDDFLRVDKVVERVCFLGGTGDETVTLGGEVCICDRPLPAGTTTDEGCARLYALPSWTVLATGDKAAGTDVVRSMARRAGATITEVEGSHVITISQPQVVTDVILSAVAAVGQATG
jgi:hypothetical protein